MAKSETFDQFEHLVLTAVLTLLEDAYGGTIQSKVRELARPNQGSLGTIYMTLARLDDQGLVSSWLSVRPLLCGFGAGDCRRNTFVHSAFHRRRVVPLLLILSIAV